MNLGRVAEKLGITKERLQNLHEAVVRQSSWPEPRLLRFEKATSGIEAGTVVFENGEKIIGFIHGSHFDLRVLTVGFNPKRTGLGELALKFLRPKFKKISVNEIYEDALPFWVKMKERGLVDCLETVKEGKDLYYLSETSDTETPAGHLTIISSVDIVNVKRNQGANKAPETRDSGHTARQHVYPPPDPELEYVCAI